MSSCVKSASSDKPPPDILPAGRKLRRVHSQRAINQKQGLNNENFQIVRRIHTGLFPAFTEHASRSSGAGRRLSQLHHGGRAKSTSESYHRGWQHSSWCVLVVWHHDRQLQHG